MTQTIRILLPIFPTYEVVYFKGFVKQEHQDIIIYITDYAANYEDFVLTASQDKDVIIGFCSECNLENNLIGIEATKNFLAFENRNGIRINKIIIHEKHVVVPEDCIIMLYDRKKFQSSEAICNNNTTDNFAKLHRLLKEDAEIEPSDSQPNVQGPLWLSSSMFAQHLLNYYYLIRWIAFTVSKEKRVSIKMGNLILAILTDIILGYFILELLTQDKKALSIKLMGALETLVNMMYSLLKWLMGSPAGLKLNNAFNKMLGKYFSYHIQLWWLFLDVSGEKLDVILHMYHYIGYFGLTFQAAMVSDLICIATFHSYCIYVYAARLFNIQVSGIIALLRLFVGKKYNPLRGGIDSCEYTNQELFVGTVAFTILLLLLPTTTMYYIVFTLFRLLSLGVQHILAKLIYMVQTLPLYGTFLWLVRSPKVAGNILLQVQNNEEGHPLVLKIQLFNKSLQELLYYKPPVEPPTQFKWTNVLSNVFRGKQIN